MGFSFTGAAIGLGVAVAATLGAGFGIGSTFAGILGAGFTASGATFDGSVEDKGITSAPELCVSSNCVVFDPPAQPASAKVSATEKIFFMNILLLGLTVFYSDPSIGFIQP
ncbi:hypothetical protein EH171_00760 [Enterovibrio baiacu]|nr:hypothetical protein [Enterovibrio baiacu]